MSTSVITATWRTAESIFNRRRRRHTPITEAPRTHTEAELRDLFSTNLGCTPDETAIIMTILARAARWTERECFVTPLQSEAVHLPLTRLLSNRTRAYRVLCLRDTANVYFSSYENRPIVFTLTIEDGVMVIRS